MNWMHLAQNRNQWSYLVKIDASHERFGIPSSEERLSASQVLCSVEQQSRCKTRGSSSGAAEDSMLPGQYAMLKVPGRSWGHPASYSIDTGSLSLSVKQM